MMSPKHQTPRKQVALTAKLPMTKYSLHGTSGCAAMVPTSAHKTNEIELPSNSDVQNALTRHITTTEVIRDIAIKRSIAVAVPHG
jgi:hypothetical protein